MPWEDSDTFTNTGVVHTPVSDWLALGMRPIGGAAGPTNSLL